MLNIIIVVKAFIVKKVLFVMLNVYGIQEISPKMCPAFYSDSTYHFIVMPQPVTMKISRKALQKTLWIFSFSAVPVFIQHDRDT